MLSFLCRWFKSSKPAPIPAPVSNFSPVCVDKNPPEWASSIVEAMESIELPFPTEFFLLDWKNEVILKGGLQDPEAVCEAVASAMDTEGHPTDVSVRGAPPYKWIRVNSPLFRRCPLHGWDIVLHG